MKISRLRLLGFKSFVEPADLIIEPGLTGVVGPNGCGKSNLLEAIRWVMGETSHKSMRAANMDDVIFSGTNTRPARNVAEVTIFLDNSARQAPAEFNDNDTIEITRRIERDAGSAYRINNREARARDVKILFEDAATGARSPALVRQGQISEIVNAKPEQRRRVLEDAAGVAGLHSRRHEAELRLKAAEGNLARLGDIMGQLGSQVEGLKRQARHARRYKDLSEEIRRSEALIAHLTWMEAQANAAAEESALAETLALLAAATEAESHALVAEANHSETLQPLRDEEAARGAALARYRIEYENLERETVRTQERERELANIASQLHKDLARETVLISESKDILDALALEAHALDRSDDEASAMDDHLHGAHEQAEEAVRISEKRLGELTQRAAEVRARRSSLESTEHERRAKVKKLQDQLAALARDAQAITLNAPDSLKLAALTAQSAELADEISAIEDSTAATEERLAELQAHAQSAREAAALARLALAALVTERETLSKIILRPSEDGLPPVIDQLRVSPGYEAALAASLGEDLDAPVADDAPVSWRQVEIPPTDSPLPADAEPLSMHVGAPPELARRLNQIGVIPADLGTRLQPLLRPGQRLVSREGDLWRWDGYTTKAGGMTSAAQRLAERNRLSELYDAEEHARARFNHLNTEEQKAHTVASAAEAEAKRLRAQWRDAQAKLATNRNTLSSLERAASETETKLAALFDARARAEADSAEAQALLDQTQDALALIENEGDPEPLLAPAQRETAHLRTALTIAATQLANHERERITRATRREAIAAELNRWTTRSAGANEQIATLEQRIAKTKADQDDLRALIPTIEDRRQILMDGLAEAETARNSAADRLAEAERAVRSAATRLRDAQSAVSTAREARARTQARLEAAQIRLVEEGRRIQETLNAAPDDCLRLTGLAQGAPLPSLPETDRNLQRLKADRDRLGGVNLQAEDELNVLLEQVSSMETERADVEQAIAKLRGAIGQLNREGKKRLEEAFDTVNRHFQRLFTTLFGGGEARLELIEGEDPMASGLEIFARPPGKKPATLSLLSGGEQTLTALSLIFAVFLTNPSPICVLDEVDAPLDDANVDRFCTLMEKMAEETSTRFLAITHHPMTMTRMNRLFGVTMAEKGVSQLVSVDLETARTYREAS